MTDNLHNIIGNPDNWPTIAQNIDGGEYLVEQLDTLLAWARRKAAEYGAANDLAELPQAGEGICADCQHDHLETQHHDERFTIGTRDFCRSHAAPRIRAIELAQKPTRTLAHTISTGNYPMIVPTTWEQEQKMRAQEQAKEAA